jgi:hypothetical protein
MPDTDCPAWCPFPHPSYVRCASPMRRVGGTAWAQLCGMTVTGDRSAAVELALGVLNPDDDDDPRWAYLELAQAQAVADVFRARGDEQLATVIEELVTLARGGERDAT